MMRALVLYAHGSRDPQWAAPLEQICNRVRAADASILVELAFLELQAPTLDDAVGGLVAQGVTAVTVVPMFLGQGAHLKRDVTARLDGLRKRNPAVTLTSQESLGESAAVLDALALWLRQMVLAEQSR